MFFSRSPSIAEREPLFDVLEPRLALYAAPFLLDFPDTSGMASDQNTIVRMQTSEGIIDIELYDRVGPDGATAAPNTVANFLRYISSGHYDNTFFHRLGTNFFNERFALQGGGFRFDASQPAAQRAQAIPTFDPIANEFDPDRSNITRTIAMARLGGQPNSATGQFFFNLLDNESLDITDGGFTVFGRVLSGWDVVESISGLQISNQAQTLGNAFGELPVTQTITGGQITDDHLVRIIDIDVIKPAASSEFYEHSLYFPDGFRSGNSTATVALVNLDPNTQSFYEVIARFEVASRDRVISTGILTPGAQLSIPVHIAGDPSVDTVRGGAPFAYEVRATGPIAASLTHTDFGATTTQSFINPRELDAGELQEWHFALGQKGTGVPSFLVWQNLSDQPAQVIVSFTSESGASHVLSHMVNPYRRGGMNVNLIAAIPEGAYSALIVSTQPIVAALSQYRAAPGRAAIETGAIGGPSTQGVLPGAIISSEGQSILSIALAQTPGSPVIIDFDFILPSGEILTSAGLVTLDAGQMRHDLDLSAAHGGLPTDLFFTIRYRVRDDAAPVSASYLALVNGQTIRSSFQTLSSKQVYFAAGNTDPDVTGGANTGEYISLYNPHMDPAISVTYSLRFHFIDDSGAPGTLLFADGIGAGFLGPGRSLHIPVRDLTNIMQRINSGSQFQVYGVTVTAEVQQNNEEVPGAIFAQLTQIDPAAGSAAIVPTIGTVFPQFFLTNPIFN